MAKNAAAVALGKLRTAKLTPEGRKALSRLGGLATHRHDLPGPCAACNRLRAVNSKK